MTKPPAFSTLSAGAEPAATASRGRLPVLRRYPAPALWRWASVGIGVLIVAPLAAVVLGTAGSGDLLRHLAQTVLGGYVARTIVVTASVSLLAGAIGALWAWLVTRYQFPGRRLLEIALITPLAMPPFVVAYAYSGLFDPFGPVSRMLGDPALVYRYFDISSTGGLIFVLTVSLYPYAYLVVRNHMQRVSAREIDVAGSLGTRRPFFRVVLPLSRPAIAAGMGMIMMDAIGEYGAAEYLGVQTLTTGVFRAWFAHGSLPTARLLATALLLVSLIAVSTERLSRGRARYTAGHSRGSHIVLRGTRALLAIATAAMPVVLGIVLPVAQLARWALQSGADPRWATIASSTFSSFAMALLAAAACVAGGIVFAYVQRLAPGSLAARASGTSYFGHAVPGGVVAVGLLAFFGGLTSIARLVSPEASPLLVGSLVGLLIGYFIRYVGVAARPLESAFGQIVFDQDAAGRSLGAGTLATLFRVDLPIIWPTVLSGALLVALDVLKELPLTLVLRPFDFSTLAVRSYELASDERVPQSALPALVLVVLSLGITLGLQWIGKRRSRR
ncbi:MAG: ABC transporter permease [Spirochaetota bacterium]